MANTELLTLLKLVDIINFKRWVNIFISRKPFFTIPSNRLNQSIYSLVCELEGAKDLQQWYLLAEQTASATLFTVIFQQQKLNALPSSLPWLGECSSELIFRSVFSLSDEMATVNLTAFWVRPCGWWLGTPSCKRHAIMHSAHSCWEVTVFHRGLWLNPILSLSTLEGNFVSGNQCVTVGKFLVCDGNHYYDFQLLSFVTEAYCILYS